MAFPVDVDASWLDGGVAFDGGELRRADSVLLAGNNNGYGPRGGIARHDDSSLLLSIDASDNVTIKAGAGAAPGNYAVGSGVYRFGLAADSTNAAPARHSTNPRVDLYVGRALDASVRSTHGAYKGRFDVIQGVADGSMAAPALPEMAFEIGRVTMPKVGGPAATVDLSYRTFTSALNAPLLVTTAARLPTTGLAWQEAIALDTGVRYTWNPAVPGWVSGMVAFTPTWTAVTTNPVLGNGIMNARWNRRGSLIDFTMLLTMGSTTTYGNGLWLFTFPTPIINGDPLYPVNSSATLYDVSAGTAYHSKIRPSGVASTYRLDVFSGTPLTVNGLAAATTPFTWAQGDQISVSASYEAAA